MAKAARETWAKRVERWKDSGLTAGEFAAEMGINPRTLAYWKWRLGRKEESAAEPKPARRSRGPKSKKRSTALVASPLSFVEVGSSELTRSDTRFELELPTGERVRISADFNAEGLRRLLGVLEERR